MRTSRCGIVFLLFVLFSVAVCGQKISQKGRKVLLRSEQSRNLKKFVDNLRPAFLHRDYEVLAAQMFVPGEVQSQEEAPDEDKKPAGIAVIKKLFEDTAADGMTFIARLKSPQKIVAAADNLFAVVPHVTIITVAEGNRLKRADGSAVKPGKYTGKGFILAVSTDEGVTWKYLSAFSEAAYKNIFPETAGKIKFPKIQMPSFLNGS